ncbi:helix-hairpin-helix domain-containing protein [Marivirga arenosa]|uniref:Helix-hairpin-helix domain-containing protein n=1 Tax=Marivirga arenosa TaxID=3059076 RepID=A0AA51N566_9BACT|nr:helix-hairpin-helix domain-containing protein [Marivirga sp. ABR2-2]WMN06332.1 helix-hairpin-helix domain-containing protein [Marivirga sp. ABR2-2]
MILKNYILSILILIQLFSINIINAQQQDFDLEDFIERNFPIQDSELNYEDVYESLFQIYQSPINLNKANRQDLQSLLILSNIQINEFLAYRAKNGDFLSIYELQAVPEFDLQTIKSILPFISIIDDGLQSDNRYLLRRILEEENNYLIIRSDRVIEPKAGYDIETDNPYLGSPNRVYTRFRISHNDDFSFGFTAEKDAGEKLSWNPGQSQYGMDYWSFHAQLENIGKLKNIILGDYQLQLGQSLLFGAGFSVGKGSQTVATARRSNLGALPYTSVLETNFFRGIAATYSIHSNLDFTSFYSYNSIDASTEIDSALSQEEYFSSIRLNGFHRTNSELEAKNAINAQNFGGNLLFTTTDQKLNVGLNFIQTIYDRPYFRQNTKYNQFEFSGDQNSNYGLFVNYYWRNFHFFGESAMSSSKGIGSVGGFIASLASNVQTSIVLRHYQKDFHSFYGNAFGENTRNINEKGVYWGLEYQPFRKLSISAYHDQFIFPWLKFRADAPSKGNESLIRFNYKFNRQINFYSQFRIENKERNVETLDESNLYGLANGQKRNYIVNLDLRPKSIISFKMRAQFSEYLIEESYTNGMAIIQDINFDLGNFRLSTRYSIFDTDDYENRQYVYEKDVLYAFSIPAYQNTGTRNYVLAQYKFSKNLQLWARYSQFRYLDLDSIGSGNEEINGNTKSEVKFQMMLKI